MLLYIVTDIRVIPINEAKTENTYAKINSIGLILAYSQRKNDKFFMYKPQHYTNTAMAVKEAISFF